MERSLWADLGRDEYVQNFRFCWAPSGKAIYFERSLNGARNLWRMTMDPATLRATGLERLTTGPGTDTELSLSSNGKMLAFTGATQQVRGWLFPLNADRGVVTGPGQAITSPGIEAWTLTLSPDGKKLGWGGVRTNQWELWQRTLADGSETPIGSQGPHTANLVVWSPDGTRLAYSRENPSTGEFQIVEWSSLDRTETPVLKPFPIYQQVYDWSPDGKSLLISQGKKGSGSPEIWQVMLASPPALSTERLAVASDKYELYQAHFSPDGRWIAFEAVRPSPAGVESALYVMPAAGGPWIRLTDGQHWDDKPRWSPDGKVIYFISGRTNFYGVWGIHFDPQHGRPVGEPFLLKAFDNPSMTVPTNISAVDISVRRGSLVVPLQQLSGGIWILDNVDQ
jgi:Tol biopolymer transport system component